MDEKRLEIRVGLVVLVALGLLVMFIFILGDFTMGEGYNFYVDLQSSGDIQDGAAIRMGGVRVGKVDSVKFLEKGPLDRKTGRRVLIRLKVWMKKEVRELLRMDSSFIVTARGVLGEKYLSVSAGSSKAAVIKENQVIRGFDIPPIDLIAVKIFTFIDKLNSILDDKSGVGRGFLNSAGDLMKTLGRVLKENRVKIKGIVGSVDTLVNEARKTVVGARQMMARLEGKLSTLLDRGKSLVGHVNRAVGDARSLMASGKRVLGTGEDGRRILANTRAITGLIRKKAPALLKRVDSATVSAKALMDKARTKLDPAISHILDIAKSAKSLMKKLLRIVDRINRGEGTVGALLKDEEIYDNIRQLLRDLKQHPWKVLWKN